MGKSLPRIDIPGKVTGGVSYVQDLRLPGMVHARVVRPPSYGARLKQVDVAAAEKMPGVLKVVRNGSYLAVIASLLALGMGVGAPDCFPPDPFC